MGFVGRVDSLWRYPVKSMRGEELAEAYVGFSGVYGDRLYAFRSSASPVGFPFLTGREQEEMILYRPRFRHPEKAAMPPNLAESEMLSPIQSRFASFDTLKNGRTPYVSPLREKLDAQTQNRSATAQRITPV